jgi:choline dehydrogenase-like flavoprotein
MSQRFSDHSGSSCPEVIIVGSGPAGVSAAWPLLEAGIAVTMIDAGSETPLPSPPRGDIGSFRRDPSRWEVQFGRNLAGLQLDGDQSPKLSTPLAREVLTGFATTIGLQVRDFLALGSLSRGGLSNIWGAVAPVYDDEDLADFPIRQADLLPSYAAVMARIGVSGSAGAHGLPVEEGPMLTAPAQRLLNAAVRSPSRDGFVLERTTNAVLMGARSGREPCARCGLCLWGCERRSVYVSGLEIPQLGRFPHFRYFGGALVRRLLPHAEGHAVDIEGKTGRVLLPAPRILLAAGTTATTSLVLRRLGFTGSTRLLTNPVSVMAFMIPALFATPPPKRSFALGQLSYRLPLRDGGRAAGVIYGADALPLAAIAAGLPISRPAALRLTRALAPSVLLAMCYLPGRFSANTLRVADGDDQRQIVIIEGEQTEEARETLLAAGRRLAREMRRLGAFALPGSLKILQPGADAHYAGTLPMGGNGPAACAPTGELKACPGLYIADGAVLPYLPAKHCTLTIMANADRIARALATHILSEREVRPEVCQ